MSSEVEKVVEWKRTSISLGIGFVVTMILINFLPGKSEEKQEDKKTNRVVESKPIEVKPVESKPIEVKPVEVKIIPDEFKKYKVVLEVEFDQKTKVDNALKDLKKACSLLQSSPSIDNIKAVEAFGQERNGTKVIEHKISLGDEN
jgi:hypothetical protein